MVNSTEEFVSNFHLLKGETLGERRKNFRLLLKKTQQSLKDGTQQLDFSLLKPENYFEEILKVEALIYFRRVSHLMEILKSENPVHIAKVLNVSSSFLAEAFKDVNGDELVNKIFPRLSFNTKLKLVNKLALHLEDLRQLEDFFEAVRKNYGLYLASKLLPGCSGDFIVKSIKTNRIEITPGQLLIIVKKYPELTETIFETLNGCNMKIEVAEKYKNVFVCLMQHNFSMFLKLNEKYNPKFCLGRRSTKTIISGNNQKIINESKKIHKLLKNQQVIRSLKQEFKEFYFNLFPTSLSQCEEEYENLLALLEHMPSDTEKVNLLADTFKKIHGNEIWDYPKFITAKVIELMSPDYRDVWMQTHSKPTEISEEEWISYMKTEKSLPLLKERISFTSNIKARANLVTHLLTTCKINKDNEALADVCKYMITKHHNDHFSVRQEFLKVLMDSFGLDKLGEEHWVHINELIQFGVVSNEFFYANAEFLRAYINYRLGENLSVDEELKRWAKFRFLRFRFKEPKYEKQCLLSFGEIVSLGHKETELSYAYVNYLNYLSCWNEEHPEYQISLLPYTTARDYFKSSLKKSEHSWGMEKIILQFIHSNITEEEKLELLNDFFACEDTWMNGALLKWLLINKPSYLLTNINDVIKTLLRVGSLKKLPSLWIYFKNYVHLGIPQKMREILINYVKTKQDDIDVDDCFRPNELGCAVTALSRLMEAADFIDLISSYYPSSLTVDMQSEEGRRMFKLQKAIAVAVRNVIPPSLALDSVLRFSKGDYLGFVQKSLYSVSQNVAGNKLPSFFNELSTRAVSVRKHSIYLTVKVSNKAEIYGMLKRLMVTEKNSSIRKCLFKGAFNYFINYPDDSSWELLKENVRLLDVNDKEAFNVLAKWKRIPAIYVQSYIIFTWSILDNLSNSKDVEEKKGQILEAFTPTIIPLLPKEFCTGIIQKHLFQTVELSAFQTKIHSFTSKCIIYSKSGLEQEEYLKLAFSILENYVTHSWYDTKLCIFGRKSVFDFIEEFSSDFLEKSHATEVFRKFVRLWNNFLKPHEALDKHLYLQFTLIYLECTKLLEIGEKLHTLYQALLKLNGPVINDDFHKILKLFVRRFLLSDAEDTAEENRYILLKNLMNNSDSTICLMLAIFLLPDKIPLAPKLKLQYNAIVESLLKEQDSSVQIYLNKYLLLSSDQLKISEGSIKLSDGHTNHNKWA